MRPELLELKNFGPFHGEHRADFGALGDFFLVCGETGAGKTTLFDAVSYAFYGEAPGSRRGLSRQLRSQYAQESDESFVQLSFSIGKGRWRIRRTLPCDRISARTKKAVSVPEEVSLERMTESGWEAATPGGKKETDRKILSLVKLSADEFSRIVLLPQGEFSRFLKQNSEERKEILSKLFPVSIYRDAAEKIREGARAAESAAADAKARKDALAEEFNPETFAEEKQRLDERVAALEKEGAEIQQKMLECSNLLERARRIAERRERLKVAEGAWQKEVEGREKDCAAWQERLDAASRAAPVAGLIGAYKAACKDLEAASAKAEQTQAQLEETLKGLALLELDRERAESADGEIASLVKRRTLIEGAVDAASEFERSASKIKGLETFLIAKNEEQTALKAGIAQAEAMLKERESECGGDVLVRLTEEKAALERNAELTAEKAARTAKSLRQKAEHEALQAKHESAMEEIKIKEEGLKSAGEDLERARAALKAAEDQQMASALALDLEEGCPCPVCGSVHHPAPAKRSAESLETLQQGVKAAEQARACADAELQAARVSGVKAEGELRALALQMESLEREGGAFSGSEEAEGVLAVARARAEDAARALESAGRALKEAAALKAKAEELRGKLEKNGMDLQEAERSLAVLRERSEAALARFKEAFPDTRLERAAAANALKECEGQRIALERFVKGFREKDERLRSQKASHEGSIKELKENVEGLRAKAAEAESRLKEEYLAAGFSSCEEAELSCLALEKRNELSARIDSFKRRKAELENQISVFRQDLAAEMADAPHDMDGAKLKAKCEELGRCAEENRARRDEAVSTLSALEGSRKRWEELEEECAKKREEADSLSALSADLQGRNPRGIKFESWILSQYLEEIAEYANIRIARLSCDRYRLRCGGSFRKGNAMTGLDLEIFDSHTGKARPAATLSGGETFMASISLALGLADSIQSRSGGIQLEAVFIDEGFGSLDDDCIELAMDILDEIRGQRMVGIVSHVGELKARIPKKIEVKKRPSGGSFIRQVFAEV